jgi:hypothetical protein
VPSCVRCASSTAPARAVVVAPDAVEDDAASLLVVEPDGQYAFADPSRLALSW